MIELAFILPIILLLGTVGIEMANYAVTSMRISQAAMHIAAKLLLHLQLHLHQP